MAQVPAGQTFNITPWEPACDACLATCENITETYAARIVRLMDREHGKAIQIACAPHYQAKQNGAQHTCECGEIIIQEKSDPWFHVDSGSERCEVDGVESDDFAQPVQQNIAR